MDDRGTVLLAAMGLGAGARVLLDSSAIICYREGGGSSRAAMEAVVDAAAHGLIRLRASALVWTEILRAPLDPETGLAYRRFLADSSLIVIDPVDVAVAEAAAGILAALDRGRPFPGAGAARTKDQGKAREAGRGGGSAFFADALHLASAIAGRCQAVLTKDEAWAGAAPPGLRVILLDELAAVISMVE
ncbi:MAG TPA: hypothetical protein VMV44_03990 [Rectinemataceae bacterium]|nr:hypothetical protein [Rectinemataceae bacterium]